MTAQNPVGRVLRWLALGSASLTSITGPLGFTGRQLGGPLIEASRWAKMTRHPVEYLAAAL